MPRRQLTHNVYFHRIFSGANHGFQKAHGRSFVGERLDSDEGVDNTDCVIQTRFFELVEGLT